LEQLVLLTQRNGESKALAEAAAAAQGMRESVFRKMSTRIRVWADLGSPFSLLGQP